MVKVRTAVILILLVVSVLIITANSLNLGDSEDRYTFADLLWRWTLKAGSNTIDTVGYAFGKDWGPDKVNVTVNESIDEAVAID